MQGDQGTGGASVLTAITGCMVKHHVTSTCSYQAADEPLFVVVYGGISEGLRRAAWGAQDNARIAFRAALTIHPARANQREPGEEK